MITIAELRRKYPNPMTNAEYRDGAYCVGGALCLELGGLGANFPEAPTLSRYLRKANPNLTQRVASLRAAAILEANDRGDFETAWRLLEGVLP